MAAYFMLGFEIVGVVGVPGRMVVTNASVRLLGDQRARSILWFYDLHVGSLINRSPNAAPSAC